MRVMHIALGGCLKSPPVCYGLTEDTGGHIAYVLGAAMAQARRGDVSRVDIVTRAFDDASLGACHAASEELVATKCVIRRLRTTRRDYLSKEALEAELPALQRAFLEMLTVPGARPDVIHAHFADAAELARAAYEAFGIPWVYSSHSLALDKLSAGGEMNPALRRRIDRERAAIRGAVAIIASSRDEAERQIVAYDATAEGRTHRVSPGVTVPRTVGVAPARRLIAPFLREADKPVILAVARPIRKKNLVSLVEAYALDPVLQQRANLVVLAGLRNGLQGQGDEPDAVLADLFDAVDRHDLWGRVALPRRHSSNDVAALYALAAEGGVFVNPAHHEPFGLTLIEAAQANVPLVATNKGGPVDIIKALGSGALVDPSDPADIALGIRRVLLDPNRARLAQRAGKRARRIYDWDRWADRVQEVCRGLVSAAPAISKARALLVSDIDGTLTGDTGAAHRFRDWREAHGDTGFAVATGRSVVEARRVLADWKLPMPEVFITSVGTEIWRWTGAGGLELCPKYAAEVDADWCRSAIEAELAALALPPQPAHDQRRWKLSFFGDVADARRVDMALRGLPARVVHSHGKLIDVLPLAAGKAAAIRFEAHRRGLTNGDCVVAGDSGNDLDMLESFARAIVPANASDEVAAAAGVFLSRFSYADGVLEGLARFGLAAPLPHALAAE
ncbi:HAD family hydrolase [Halovulum sp. GXIMD14794]